MEAKRIVNFRAFLFSAVFSAAGILSVYLMHINLAIGVALLIAALLAIAILYIIYRRDVVKLVGMTIVAAVFLYSIASSALSFAAHENRLPQYSDYVVSGKIVEITDNGIDKAIIITDVRLTEDSVDGNAILYISNSGNDEEIASYAPGDVVAARCELHFVELIASGSVNAFAYKNSIRYEGYVSGADLILGEGNPSFIERLRYKIKSTLCENMTEKYGNIAYGMLIGDKSTMDYSTRDYFSVAGIGHVLSVSGLHVTFILSVLTWVLKRLKVKRIVSLLIVVFVLLFYNILVGFTASVVRATIMAVCLSLAGIIGARNDTLNNLGLATTVILIFSPLSLFDSGFLMSVCAVFGIALFYKPIAEALIKTRIPKLLGKAIATTVSAQAGILPVLVFFFKSVSVYSVIANVLLVPVIMLAFVLLAVLLIPSLIIKQVGIVLTLPKWILQLIDLIARLIAGLPLSEVIVYSGVSILVIYLAYFIFSRFVTCGKAKAYVACALMVLSCAALVVENFPVDSRLNAVYFTSDYNQVTSVIKSEGKVIVVGDFFRAGNTDKILERLKVRRVDALYLTELNQDSFNGVITLSRNYDVGEIYLPDAQSEYACQLEQNGLAVRQASLSCDQNGLALVEKEEEVIGYEMTYEGFRVLFAGYETKMNKDMLEVVSSYQIVRALSCNYRFFSQLFVNNYDNTFFHDQPANYLAIEKDTYRLNLDTQKVEKF